MGSGMYSVRTHALNTSSKLAAGKSIFDHSDSFRRGEVSTVHESVDPKIVAGDASPHAGQVMREVCFSNEHPNPTPIVVMFDVTGSMGHIPEVLQRKLPQLQGLLQRKGYVEDPQILFGAIGDAYSDRVPLQVGQFESDNRMDEQLESLVLESGGGGGNHESYELAAYFLARHTYQEPFERDGRKGFVFFIGDERLYGKVNRGQVKELIGDNLQADISTEDIFEELKAKYEIFFLFVSPEEGYSPGDSLYNGGRARGSEPAVGTCYWRDLLGQTALELGNPEAVCETIAMQMAVAGGVNLEEATQDLLEEGADAEAAKAASKALTTATASS